MSANIRDVNSKASFKRDVLRVGYPVVVDFWADWCGPCRQLVPSLEELAARYAGRLRVVKVNVDVVPEIAAKYSVRSIPMVALFENGQLQRHTVGVKSVDALARELGLE